MELLEREPVLDVLETLLDDARHGSGRVAVVRGEAGIGKTSVVKAFFNRHQDDAHLLWGACDDLLTPQPLGPIWDMAFQETSLEESLAGEDRARVFRALRELLARQLQPTVMVVEDLHWADEATSDLVRYLGRRIQDTHGLLILTIRDEDEDLNDPVRLALGDLPPDCLHQIALNRLNHETVSELAGDFWNPDELWRLTNGNPFFVTELLEARSEGVPVTIRDATRARVLRLSQPARELVELSSVVPGKAEISLIEDAVSGARNPMSESARAGILEVEGRHLSFRHELTRRAVEEGLSEIKRRDLNMRMLRVSEAREEDVAFCAHFAREAGDTDAILRFLPRAAQRAIELGSRREALSHLRALEPYVDQLQPTELADHYEAWAQEEHFGDGVRAADLISKAIRLRRGLADAVALARSLLIGAELVWWRKRRSLALEMAREAVSILESADGEDLAMAYSTLSRLALVASDAPEALKFADKALAHAGDEPNRTRVHALANRGTAIAETDYPDGLADLEKSYEMAESLGLIFDQGRAAFNIGWTALESDRDIRLASRWFQNAIELVEEAEIPGVANGARSALAWVFELSGEWDKAQALARSVAEDPAAGIYKSTATFVLARVLIRSGNPAAMDVSLDAWEQAKQADEPHFRAPAGSALLELLWLGGEVHDEIIDEIVAGYRALPSLRSGTPHSELAFWLSLVGTIDSVHEDALEPFVLLDRGKWEKAAGFWEKRGITYERAMCLSFGDTEAKLDALSTLDWLGAVPLARKIRGELKEAGVDQVPRGPQHATRQSALGLTPRQAEVLGLLAEDLTNAEIADRLFISERTVENHVSAILTKLNADDRVDAVEQARTAQAID